MVFLRVWRIRTI